MSDLEALKGLYAEVGNLAKLGSETAVRRAQQLIAKEINATAGRQLYDRCGGPREADEQTGKAVMPIESIMREISTEERRKSILLDPVEALAAEFVNLYTGRTTAFEARIPGGRMEELEVKATERAAELLQENYELVRVVLPNERLRASVVLALRSIADRLESHIAASPPAAIDIANGSRDVCEYVGDVFKGERWSNSSPRKMFHRYAQTYKCKVNDYCCENSAWYEERRRYEVLVWTDGDSTAIPPYVPPAIEPYQWDNRCAVFDPVMIGPGGARVTSHRGWRFYKGELKFHSGMDIAVPTGTPVRNSVAGLVVRVKRDHPAGENYVAIRTGDEVRQYMHVTPRTDLVEFETFLSTGDLVGTVGPWADGAHLHYARFRSPTNYPSYAPVDSLEPCPPGR